MMDTSREFYVKDDISIEQLQQEVMRIYCLPFEVVEDFSRDKF
jgi:hypothetical protein